MESTTVKTPKKPRSDMGYFDSLFNSLGPLKHQEVDWKRQKYASIGSAAGSIKSALTKRHINTVNIKTAGDRLYLYSNNFLGILPCDKHADINTAYKKANELLNKYPEYDAYPIPSFLIPIDSSLNREQMRDKLNYDIKAAYPYLTVETKGKTGFVIKKDRSYGNLCFTDTITKLEPEDIKESWEIIGVQGTMDDEVVMAAKTEEEERTATFVKLGLLPELPLDIASDVAKYLSKKGKEVTMSVKYTSTCEYMAVISVTDPE